MDNPLYKENDMFYHEDQKLFVIIDKMDYITNGKKGNGWLYTLKCFQHENELPKPFKRYYENKILETLIPLNKNLTTKILYGK